MNKKSINLSVKTLFLIDAIGAASSTFFLGFVLIQFQEYIGMPKQILQLLAGIALCFMVYSIMCYSFETFRRVALLKVIGIMNFTYSLLTLVLVIFYFQELTTLGLLYFLGEVAILWILVSFELRVRPQ